MDLALFQYLTLTLLGMIAFGIIGIFINSRLYINNNAEIPDSSLLSVAIKFFLFFVAMSIPVLFFLLFG